MNVDFDRISGSLRSLLMLWSSIERSAREEVARENGGAIPNSAYGIAAVLKAWEETVVAKHQAGGRHGSAAKAVRARLKDHLTVRNGICHGLDGVASAQGEKPAMLTWNIGGEKQSATWDELQASFEWLSRAPGVITTISASSCETVGSRFIDSPENLEWWHTEFGLSLAENARST